MSNQTLTGARWMRRGWMLLGMALLFSAPAAHAATVSISANPANVTSGSTSTLTWSSTAATSCAASGDWSGIKATFGSQSVLPLNASNTYTLNCSGPLGGASNAAVVSVDALPNTPPTVALTAPTFGTSFTAPANITLSATAAATVASATISKVDFFNGAALLSTATASPYTYTWAAVPAGSYSLTARATDSLGSAATSTTVSVTVTSPTPPAISLTSPASGATFESSAIIPLAAMASTATRTITKIEFFDGAALLGTINGNTATLWATFNFTIASVGSHAISAKATDSMGNVTSSAVVNIVVVAAIPVTMAITSPTEGAVINDNRVTVTGTFQAPANSSIVVNGVAAMLSGNTFYAVDVPLQTGANTLTVMLTTIRGETVTQTLHVTGGAPQVVQISADKSQGLAPLTVTFKVSGVTGAYTASVSNAGGTLDQSDPAVLFKINYTTPGVYQPTVTITGSAGALTSKTFTIVVQDRAQLNQVLKSQWEGLNNALIVGDKPTALRYFNVQAQAKYGPVFDELMLKMPEIIASYSALAQVSIGDEIAEYVVVRGINGIKRPYFIYFIKDQSGIWKIDGM